MEIWDIKEKVLEQLGEDAKRGAKYLDGDMVDIFKDLAEAEYYCSVVEAMDEGRPGYPMGYMDDGMMMGYPVAYQGGYGRRGYNQNRSARTGRYARGYMGYEDKMAEAKRLLGEMTAEERKAVKDML